MSCWTNFRGTVVWNDKHLRLVDDQKLASVFGSVMNFYDDDTMYAYDLTPTGSEGGMTYRYMGEQDPEMFSIDQSGLGHRLSKNTSIMRHVLCEGNLRDFVLNDNLEEIFRYFFDLATVLIDCKTTPNGFNDSNNVYINIAGADSYGCGFAIQLDTDFSVYNTYSHDYSYGVVMTFSYYTPDNAQCATAFFNHKIENVLTITKENDKPIITITKTSK